MYITISIMYLYYHKYSVFKIVVSVMKIEMLG